MNKYASRLRRAKRIRKHIQTLGVPRMTVHRTLNNIYVQVLTPESQVLAQASTLDKEISEKVSSGGNVAAAKLVGELIAKRCLEKDVSKIAFDRSGFKFHGRLKALADAARDGGIDF